MLSIYFVTSLIFLILSGWIAYELLTDNDLRQNIPNRFLLLAFELSCLLIVILTLVNVLLCIYIFIKSKNKRGTPGEKGIPGPPGIKGREGKCSQKCGQKVCNTLLEEHANKMFQTNKNNKNYQIKNIFLLNKLNLICHSSKYQDVLRREHANKPAEIKLINFILVILVL